MQKFERTFWACAKTFCRCSPTSTICGGILNKKFLLRIYYWRIFEWILRNLTVQRPFANCKISRLQVTRWSGAFASLWALKSEVHCVPWVFYVSAMRSKQVLLVDYRRKSTRIGPTSWIIVAVLSNTLDVFNCLFLKKKKLDFRLNFALQR